MATVLNSIVETRAGDNIVRPNEYMGVLKCIPISFSAIATSDDLVFTEVFGQNTKLYSIVIEGDITGGTTTIKTSAGDTLVVADLSTKTNYDIPVDVSGLSIVGDTTTGGAGTVTGYIFVTDDW